MITVTTSIGNVRKQLSESSVVPRRFSEGPAERKPPSLPSSVRVMRPPDEEEKAFLDSLPLFEVDGEDLNSVTLPPGVQYAILCDFNTDICWLTNTAGYDYPRYILNIAPYSRRPARNEPDQV